jgi:hypothetical protein
MVCVGILGGYILICWEVKKLEGNSKYLFEIVVESLNSHKGG